MSSKESPNEIPTDFIEELLDMIEDGAIGFDIAHKIEQKHLQNTLIHDGIIFYKTFLELANNIVKETPDKKKKDYIQFRTVEDTDKYTFIKWAKSFIAHQKKPHKTNAEYAKYRNSNPEWVNEQIICQKCGTEIKNKNQEICEECGTSFLQKT